MAAGHRTPTSGEPEKRRALGRELAEVRRAAGLTQRQLGAAAGYSRSAVSNAEIGHPDVARPFWARCDQVLRSDGAFARAFDQMRRPARPPDVPDRRAPGPAAGAWRRVASADPAEALAGYQELGWNLHAGAAGVSLVTGPGLEAIEVSRPAGLVPWRSGSSPEAGPTRYAGCPLSRSPPWPWPPSRPGPGATFSGPRAAVSGRDRTLTRPAGRAP